MNTKRGLTLILILALFALVLTACGSDTNGKSEKNFSDGNSDVTPTATPTPTEEPKSPEQQDLEAIERMFESAKTTAADPEYALTEGSTFVLRFEDEQIVLDLDSKGNGYERRILETWVNGTDCVRGRYDQKSEQNRAGNKYGKITGVLGSDGNISWTANNINQRLFDSLSKWGLQWAPAYVERTALYEEIQGPWYGEMQLSMQSIVEMFLPEDDKESRQFYRNMFSLLKEYGYNGKVEVTVSCNILSEKELQFALTTDWANFLDSIHKATADKDKMTRFLCVVGGIDKSTLQYVLRYQGLDVMTYGASIVQEFEQLCDSYHGENMTAEYTYSNGVLRFSDGKVADKLTYNSKDGTMFYKDFGMECTLKKQ